MSVDHSIAIGYGVRIPDEVLESWRLAGDPDRERWIGDLFDDLLSDFPLIDYIEAGSYYDSNPIQYALVVGRTAESNDNLTGFFEPEHVDVVTAEERAQLHRAWLEMTNYSFPGSAWQIGGLWS